LETHPKHSIRRLVTSAQRTIAIASNKPLAKALAKQTGIAASVIIATRDKATYLDLTLAALERQLFPEGAWEVVVSDDASRDATADVLSRYEDRKKIRVVRVQSQHPSGLQFARNKAVGVARGSVFLFLGEDCLTDPGFLTQHLRHHLRGDRVVFGDCSRLVHTHLLSPNDFMLRGASAQQVIVAGDLSSPEKLRPFVLLSGYDSRQDMNNPIEWTCNNAANASLARALALCSMPGTHVPAYFEPRAYTLRQITSQATSPF